MTGMMNTRMKVWGVVLRNDSLNLLKRVFGVPLLMTCLTTMIGTGNRISKPGRHQTMVLMFDDMPHHISSL